MNANANANEQLLNTHFLSSVGDQVSSEASMWLSTVQEGPRSLKFFAVIGCVAIVTRSALGIFDILNPFHMLFCVYTLIFGLVLTSVEANNCCGSKRCKNAIEEWCKFLSRLWGRGFVYIFIGIMMVARMEFLDLVVGCYVLFIGVLSVIVGRAAATQLRAVRVKLRRQDLQTVFRQFDADGSNTIDSSEFAAACSMLGVPLTMNETAGIVSALDSNRDGIIDFQEFESWWVNRNDHDYLL